MPEMKPGIPPKGPSRTPLARRAARAAVTRALAALSALHEARYDRHQATRFALAPEGRPRGRALLSHRIEGFERPPGDPHLATHTNFAEAVTLADLLLARGFAVDVISHLRTRPVRGDYDLLISSRENFDAISPDLPPACLRIVHLDTMHWLVNNHASLTRSLEVRDARGVTPERDIRLVPNRAIEGADLATVIGNTAVHETYAFAGKPVFEVPHPALATWDWPQGKDFEAARTRFLWLGSRGLAHKGLGRVLEAFAAMPELHLTICGPLDREPEFVRAHARELHATANIDARGWIDLTGPDFAALAGRTLALVYPSCAEAQAGSVVNCMQAGLIPMVSRATGLDVAPDFGVDLGAGNVDGIVAAVREIAARPAPELEAMARRARELARATYTRENFAKVFGAVLDRALEAGRGGLAPGFHRIPETLAAGSGGDVNAAASGGGDVNAAASGGRDMNAAASGGGDMNAAGNGGRETGAAAE